MIYIISMLIIFVDTRRCDGIVVHSYNIISHLFFWLLFVVSIQSLIISIFVLIISLQVISALLIVLIPTLSAVSHPAILPNLIRFCLHVTNFLHTYKSPQFNAQLNDAKNCYYPKFFKLRITLFSFCIFVEDQLTQLAF